jgi:tetratricopeptide (TPR) repeat protein
MPVQEYNDYEKTRIETIITDAYPQPEHTEKTEVITRTIAKRLPEQQREVDETGEDISRSPSRLSNRGKGLVALALLFFSTFVMFRSAGDNKVVIAPVLPKPPEKSSRIHIAPLPAETIALEKKEAARKKTVNKLLKQASLAYTQKRLTKPKNSSAYAYFRKVLELDPENHEAHDGIHEIGRKYYEFAELELQTNNFDKAAEYIEIGLGIIPEDSDLLSARIKIKEKKNRLLAALEIQAVQALEQNRLSTPEQDCAYKYYTEILRIDRNNPRALRGLKTISDRYANQAEKALLNLNMKKAKYLIRQGLLITPDHKLLLELQADLKRSKPGIFFKSLKKDLSTILK